MSVLPDKRDLGENVRAKAAKKARRRLKRAHPGNVEVKSKRSTDE